MSKKLCKLVSDGFLDDHTKKYMHLVNKPKYVCMKCGRVANEEESLCRPKKLKDKKDEEPEANKEAIRASKKEAKKVTQKSEGYRKINEDVANEKLKKFDEKIQKRIVKISKKDLRKKKYSKQETGINPTDETASVDFGVGSEAEANTEPKSGIDAGFKAEDTEKNAE